MPSRRSDVGRAVGRLEPRGEPWGESRGCSWGPEAVRRRGSLSGASAFRLRAFNSRSPVFSHSDNFHVKSYLQNVFTVTSGVSLSTGCGLARSTISDPLCPAWLWEG